MTEAISTRDLSSGFSIAFFIEHSCYCGNVFLPEQKRLAAVHPVAMPFANKEQCLSIVFHTMNIAVNPLWWFR
jgi:hypothetical protein